MSVIEGMQTAGNVKKKKGTIVASIKTGKLSNLYSLPKFLYFIIVSVILTCLFAGVSVFGFNIRGYLWVLQFLIAGTLIIRSGGRIAFPWYIWSPWLLVILLYLPFYYTTDNAVQRTLMIILPVLVGSAVSQYVVETELIQLFFRLVRQAALVFFIFMGLIKSGVITTGTLPEITGFAAEAITASMFAVIFAIEYLYGRPNALRYWVMMCLVPVIALTRTGIVATVCTLPGSFAPLKLSKRLLILGVAGVLAVSVFYSERFQQKTFWSGSGALSDLRLDNPDFKTTGRLWLWERMDNEIEREPWFGHGSNAQEAFIVAVTGIQGQPHNDWKRILFDYGYVGAGIFALCMLLQVIHALKMARKSQGETQMLFYAGASSFIPFIMFMFTDNIILYAVFFGSLQFTILGLAYAAKRTEDNKKTMSDKSDE